MSPHLCSSEVGLLFWISTFAGSLKAAPAINSAWPSWQAVWCQRWGSRTGLLFAHGRGSCEAPWWATSEDRPVAPGHVPTWLCPSPHPTLLIPPTCPLVPPSSPNISGFVHWTCEVGGSQHTLYYYLITFHSHLNFNSFH